MTPESAPYRGDDKLLVGIILGVLAFWLFAQTTLNIAPAMAGDFLCIGSGPHPALITADQLELLDGWFGANTIAELLRYGRGFGLPSPNDCEEVRRLMKVSTAPPLALHCH